MMSSVLRRTWVGNTLEQCGIRSRQPCGRGFPAVLCHTCDLRSAEGIIQYGRVPGGYPKSTGRAHVYFNPTPPWEAQMRKLAGTRTGRPVTVAFDTELMMQDGIRFFTSDEAFMSADWVGNAYFIYAFQTRKNKFLYFNRAYPELRKRYRAVTPGPQDVSPSFFKNENTLTAEKAWRHWRKVVDGAKDGKLLPGAVTEIATVDELAPRKGKSNERPAGPTYQVAPATLRRVPRALPE